MNQSSSNASVGAPLTRRSKLGITGFALVAAGPLLLLLANTLQQTAGDFPRWLANAVSWVCLLLPAAGFVVSVVSLFRWKKSGILGRALSLSAVIICNPFFYLCYAFFCLTASSTLAGLNWM